MSQGLDGPRAESHMKVRWHTTSTSMYSGQPLTPVQRKRGAIVRAKYKLIRMPPVRFVPQQHPQHAALVVALVVALAEKLRLACR